MPGVTGTPGPYSTLFADLYTKFTKQTVKAQPVNQAPELLVTKLPPADVALLIPADPTINEAIGVSAAKDGTAWLYAPSDGDYILITGPHPTRLHLAAGEVKKL